MFNVLFLFYDIKKLIMDRNEIVKIYNKRLNKYWECSYGAFLNNWSKYGWVIVENLKQK